MVTKKTVQKVSKKKVIAKKKVASKKTVAKKVKTTRSTPKRYKIVTSVNNQSFESVGNTLTECLNDIVARNIGTLKSKAILLISGDNKRASRTMMPFEFKRLLAGKSSKEVFEKRMILAMK